MPSCTADHAAALQLAPRTSGGCRFRTSKVCKMKRMCARFKSATEGRAALATPLRWLARGTPACFVNVSAERANCPSPSFSWRRGSNSRLQVLVAQVHKSRQRASAEIAQNFVRFPAHAYSAPPRLILLHYIFRAASLGQGRGGSALQPGRGSKSRECAKALLINASQRCIFRQG